MTVWKDYNHGSLWDSLLEVLVDTPVRYADAKRPMKKDRLIPPEFEEQLERRREYRRIKYGEGRRTEPVATRSRVAAGTSALGSNVQSNSSTSSASDQTNSSTMTSTGTSSSAPVNSTSSARVTRSQMRAINQQNAQDGADAEEGMPEELRTCRLTRTSARI